MSGFLRWYQTILNKRPLLTQVISSGLMSGAGDVLSQFAFEKRSWKTYDGWRTARFCGLAGFFIAPCLNRWFLVLEKVKSANTKLVPLKRLIIDQSCFSPLFNVLILVNLRLLEGFNVQQSYDMMKRDWSTIYFNSLKVWPAVQLVNFYFVPLNMRVIVIQIVALFWNSYLSFKTQAKVKDERDHVELW